MKLIPVNNRLLVRFLPTERVSAGGILLNDPAKQIVLIHATVVDIGSGEDVTALGLMPNDTILINKYASTSEVDIEDKNLRIIEDTDVLAIVKE